MGEHYTEREIIIRLGKIEIELATKEIRIAELEATAERYLQTEKLLQDELTRKDDIIASLTNLTPTLAGENNGGSLLANLSPTPADRCENVINEKSHHELLVIGDSVIKHCNPENILPGKDTHIACYPGARADKIQRELEKLTEENVYDQIIVHCGINFVPQYSPTYTSDKLLELIETTKRLAPSSKIAFSGLLPKIGPKFLPGINAINHSMFNAGLSKHSKFDFVQHRACIVDKRGKIDPSMFSRDGVHLSVKGVHALERSFKTFLRA